MKKAGLVAASIAAASSAALASTADCCAAAPRSANQGLEPPAQDAGSSARKGAEGRFAPRFDGLRFIETLVTAHRLRAKMDRPVFGAAEDMYNRISKDLPRN